MTDETNKQREQVPLPLHGPRGAQSWPAAGVGDFVVITQIEARPAQLDAPSWLWSSVVELVSLHEAAYLDHCRRFALARAS